MCCCVRVLLRACAVEENAGGNDEGDDDEDGDLSVSSMESSEHLSQQMSVDEESLAPNEVRLGCGLLKLGDGRGVDSWDGREATDCAQRTVSLSPRGACRH